MEKPYLLIKYDMPDCIHNVYATAEEALKDSKHTEQYPGHAICVYNLDKKEYILFEKLAYRMEQNINNIIKQRLDLNQ